MNILYTTAKEIDICESVPDNIWLHCGNNVKGECFNLNTTCFLDRNVICRYKWETLKFYNNKAIVHICKKNKDMCTVVKCGSNYPSTSPSTLSPRTLSPSTSPKTLSPSTSPKTLSPSTSPKTLSPSTLSPSTSPSTLSPKTLSPKTLSPKTLSPKTLSPSTLSPKTLSPKTLSPKTLSPTLKENNNEEFLLFTLLIVPLLIACVTKPNVCVRWWRIISCWSRRHPTQEDNTEED
jgi:hypothetical protein